MTKDIVNYFSTKHNLTFTPAGIWHIVDNKKQAIDSKRYDFLDWAQYPKDNMARTKIPEHILILDIDNLRTTIDTSTSTITLHLPEGNDLSLPLGLYTQTSRVGSYHIYYSITPEQLLDIGTTIRKLNNSDIDILVSGYVVFEAHTFSPHNELHEGEILPVPEELMELIREHNDYKQPHPAQALRQASNLQRYNLVRDFLDDKLSTAVSFNSFIKSVIPAQFHIKNKKAYKWSDFQLSYPLMNGVAVKLTTTKELDYQEHVIPTMYKILTLIGVDPQSRMSQQIIHSQIMPNLPQHESELAYNDSTDSRPFDKLISMQVDTARPLLRTASRGKMRFIEIDKYSHLPIRANDGTVFMEQSMAELYHPELYAINEDGSQGKWNYSHIPTCETIIDPYKPAYLVDEYSRHTINLSVRSRFVRSAEPIYTTVEDNILLKLIYSVIHPLYVDIYLRWLAEVVFSQSSPKMILWMATREGIRGATGKSTLTLYIPSKILGSQATVVTDDQLAGQFSVTEDKRIMSLEEGSTSGAKRKASYETMKRLQSPVNSQQNKKFGDMRSMRVKVAMSGSSNELLSLEPNDRRVLCLEPAHLEGCSAPRATEPLTQKEALLVDHIMDIEEDIDEKYDIILQGLTNHLYAIHNDPITDEMYQCVYKGDTPHTIYRDAWIITGVSNVKSIMLNLSNPRRLVDSVHIDRAQRLEECIEHVMQMHSRSNSKCALSWNWFSIMTSMIASDSDIDLSKASLSKALGNVQFARCSMWAAELLVHSNNPEWKLDMYTFSMDDALREEYKQVLLELRSDHKHVHLEGID